MASPRRPLLGAALSAALLLAATRGAGAGGSVPGQVGAKMEERARQVAAAVARDPVWPDDLFDEAFRRNVPAADLRRLLADTYAAEGAVTSVTRVAGGPEGTGRFEFACEQGGVFQGDIRLADEPQGRISFLRTYKSVPGYPDLAAAARGMRELGGEVSFEAERLGDGAPQSLASANPDAVLDVASAFKLYVLGALVDEIRAGRRQWTDTVTLDSDLRSIPTGVLHRWPEGAPVTLQTLASLMVEQSDNTAADHLLRLLGRERVEAMLSVMGNRHAERNLPLLTTGEMFRLKFADGGRHAAPYLALGVAQRRAYLRDVVDAIPIEQIDSPTGRTPRLVGAIGWFASARDLCAAMDWLRTATESGPAAPARAILAIEPGTRDPSDIFPYQGFKGGRLPGVASRTYLVRSARGRYFAVSAAWNDAKAEIDESRLARRVTRTLQLLARGS